MKYFYIIDNNGNIWGSFDSKELAQSFADTLEVGYQIFR